MDRLSSSLVCKLMCLIRQRGVVLHLFARMSARSVMLFLSLTGVVSTHSTLADREQPGSGFLQQAAEHSICFKVQRWRQQYSSKTRQP